MDQQQESDWNALLPLEKAHSLVESAQEAQTQGQDQVAYAYFAQALNLYRGLEDRSNIVRTLIRISYLAGWADFHDGQDMFTRRRLLAAEALPLAREIGDPKLLAQTLCAFYFSVPDNDPMQLLEESKALAAACNDRPTLAMVLTCMSNQDALQGDHERAEAIKREALALYEELGDKAGIARTLFSMAIRAKRAEKLAYLERALELQRELGAKKRIYEILTLLDNVCDRHDLDRREAYNTEALDLARQFGSPIWLAHCLNRLAEIAASRGDIARSDALKAESNSIYQEPEPDPDLEEELKTAFMSRDNRKIEEAVKKLTREKGAS